MSKDKAQAPYSVDDWTDETEDLEPRLDPLPAPASPPNTFNPPSLELPTIPTFGIASSGSLSGMSMPSSSFGQDIRERKFRSSEGYIYFIQRASGGAIKIGHSHKPHDRIKTLQTANEEKLTFLVIVKGSTSDEERLHSVFGWCRIIGGGSEWFDPSPELLAYIGTLREQR